MGEGASALGLYWLPENPGWSREAIEHALTRWLGATRIIWLADGLVEDDETDGHVDNVVAFAAPGRALLQGAEDPVDPNHAIAADNRARLEASGIEVVEIPNLPHAEVDGTTVPVPYVNYYVANEVVVCVAEPLTVHEPMLDARARAYEASATALEKFPASCTPQGAIGDSSIGPL